MGDAPFYDVVIVGAGPGGLSCAKHLAGSGLRVLVLEKSSGLGKKICSGEVSSKVFPGQNPSSIFKGAQEWKTVVVGTKKGAVPVSYPRPYLWTVGREELETFLSGQCDAEIRFNEPAVSITQDHVETSRGRYRYRYLVGADGSFSAVRPFLGLPMEHIVGWAFHYVLEVPSHEFRVCWLPDVFPRGYGYVMSKNRHCTMAGGAMAGNGERGADAVRARLAPRVREWVKSEFGHDTSSLRCEAFRGNADYRGWRFAAAPGREHNVFLVGDAAGLLNPVTTEGVYYAVKSGEGVAKHLLGNPEGAGIMEALASTHRKQVLLFDTFNRWPLNRFVEWVLENPKGGLRGRMFDFIFWKFMDG